MQTHIDPKMLDQDGRSGLRRAAMFRSGAAVGVVLLVFAIAGGRLDGVPTEEPAADAHAPAVPALRAPDEVSTQYRDIESADWVQGTQG